MEKGILKIVTNIILITELLHRACMEVHKKLGPGFMESVYSEALEIEFKNAGIPYKKEKKLPVYYDDKPLNKYFRADFVCYDSIILELKATKFLIEADYKQTLNNIKATNFKLGLLINFGESSLKYRRLINSHKIRINSYLK